MSGALVLPMAAQGVEIGASGHINRALVFHDREDDNIDPEHVNAGSSPSRFRFTGTGEMDNGVTAGVNVEYNIGSSANDTAKLRHAALSLGGEFGTVTMGQTAPATHIIMHNSMDGYAWLSGVEIGCDFCNADGSAVFIYGHAYGASRRPVVKYDLPPLGVANLSFSADGNDFWDAALRASGDAGALTWAFNIGFTNYAESTADPTAASSVLARGSDLKALLASEGLGDDDAAVAEHLKGTKTTITQVDGEALTANEALDDDTYYVKNTPMAPGVVSPETEATAVAVSLGFGQGTHVNVAWASLDPDGGSSGESSHFVIGHNLGNTSIAANFTNSDFGGGGDSWGLAVGHGLGEVELYAGYKALEFDLDTREDYGMFVVGSRIKFN
jgi:hypothetical protein